MLSTWRTTAPEVLNEKPYDERADTFSFGTCVRLCCVFCVCVCVLLLVDGAMGLMSKKAIHGQK